MVPSTWGLAVGGCSDRISLGMGLGRRNRMRAGWMEGRSSETERAGAAFRCRRTSGRGSKRLGWLGCLRVNESPECSGSSQSMFAALGWRLDCPLRATQTPFRKAFPCGSALRPKALSRGPLDGPPLRRMAYGREPRDGLQLQVLRLASYAQPPHRKPFPCGSAYGPKALSRAPLLTIRSQEFMALLSQRFARM